MSAPPPARLTRSEVREEVRYMQEQAQDVRCDNCRAPLVGWAQLTVDGRMLCGECVTAKLIVADNVERDNDGR